MKLLEYKDSYRSPRSMSATLVSEAPFLDEVAIILNCIKMFPTKTSYGKDGLEVQCILDKLFREVYGVVNFLCAINLVVNVWQGGRCSLSFSRFCSFCTPIHPSIRGDPAPS